MLSQLHHVGIAARDLDASIRFYRDGLGLQIVFDEHIDQEWKRLVGSPTDRMRAVMLADPVAPTCAIELVAFEDNVERHVHSGPPSGSFLLSIAVEDMAATRIRLTELGCTGFEEAKVEFGPVSVDLTFVRDPDGNVIELAPLGAVQQVEALLPHAMSSLKKISD